jgi:hypothetical protein
MGTHNRTSSRLTRWAFACGLVAAVAISSTDARADEVGAVQQREPAPTARARSARLEAHLHAAARQGRDSRHAVLLTGIVGGVAMIPVGVTLWHRPDAVSQSIGAGMTIGGAAPLLFTALSLSPSKIERLEREYERRLASGEDGGDLDRAIEAEWARLADRSHGTGCRWGTSRLASASRRRP